MIKTVVLTEHDLGAWRKRYAAGDAPDALPYGVNALTRADFALTGARQTAHVLGTKVRDLAEHRLGIPLERPLRASGDVRRSDLVLALLESQAMLPGYLKDRGMPPFRSTPLVIWSCWLADDLRRATPQRREWLLRRVRSADLITHLSRHETDIFTDLGIPEERLFPVTYGVSHEFYTPDPTQQRDIEILAVGQDRGRDYATLLEAVRGSNLTLDLVCKPENLAGLDVPANVRMHGTVPLSTYRQLLRRARIVAVPTREMAYPTGSSVALEAASSGCAVVVTGTRAMRDYFQDGLNAVLVPESDPEAWRVTLTQLSGDHQRQDALGTAARENVTGRHNATYMWNEVAQVIRDRGIVSSRV